jgi:hypothetical protein
VTRHAVISAADIASAADPPLPQTSSALSDLMAAAIRETAASSRSSANCRLTVCNNAADSSQDAAKLNESSHSHQSHSQHLYLNVNTRKHFPPARLCTSRKVKILKGRAPAKPIVVSVPINTAPYILQKSTPSLRC